MAENASFSGGSPVEQLSGTKIGEWILEERGASSPNATGGCFSVTYRAKHSKDGRLGFAKLVDLIKFLNNPDRLRVELNNFDHEKGLLELCKSHRMDGVVVTLDAGEHKIQVFGMDVSVPYLIFEVAKGDLRTHEGAQDFDLSWRLRVFHGVCVAMNQLHRAEIAHQDLKPSNVLVFETSKAKVADLGRATRNGVASSFNGFGHQGDNNYAPLELLYDGYYTTSWTRRRIGADFFMMGCLLVYLLVDASLLTLIFERLDPRFRPTNGRHSFETVLPHLECAFDKVIAEIKSELPANVSSDLIELIGWLSHPNPDRRGRPFLFGEEWETIRTRDPELYVREQYSLETVISRVDALSIRSKRGAKFNKVGLLDFFGKI